MPKTKPRPAKVAPPPATNGALKLKPAAQYLPAAYRPHNAPIDCKWQA